MKNRRAFKLRKLLVAWNVLLALFSVFGACRTLPEMYHVLKHHGFDHSVCNPSYAEHVKVSELNTSSLVSSRDCISFLLVLVS
ncbi:elongation of very long chain fatty acids protein 6-like protein, partial [Dinothrombium tinctorium]